MENAILRTRFDMKTLRMWRIIQVAALFPLILIGGLMIYFKQSSPFGIVLFFLILVVGVMIPQMRGDMILSHILLIKEIEQKIDNLKEEMMKPQGDRHPL